MFAGDKMSLVQKDNTQIAAFKNMPLMLAGWRTTQPRYYPILTQKKYKNVDRFHDHRYARMSVATWLLTWETAAEEEYPVLVNAYGHDMIGAKLAFDHNVPEFFVEPALLEATLQTKPPESTDWSSLKFPFPSLFFILPKNSLKTNNVEILCIGVSRIEAGRYVNPKNQKGRMIEIAPTSLRLLSIAADGEEYTRTVVGEYKHEELGHIANDPWQYEIDYADTEFLKNLPAIALNLLMAMMARPEYVESGVRRGTDKKSGAELWTPNIVGKRYATKIEGDGGGTHAAPRMHWRRGHFRLQRFGVGLGEEKIIWIEPTLINARLADVK